MTRMPRNNDVSPYLLRPLRSYEEALRDRDRRRPRTRAAKNKVDEKASDVTGSNDERVPAPDAGSKRR